MYVNKVPLLVTLSRNIKFGTMEAVADQKGGYYIEVHQRGGYIVPQVRVQGHYYPHGR